MQNVVSGKAKEQLLPAARHPCHSATLQLTFVCVCVRAFCDGIQKKVQE
jgi:hypothetical protein